MVKNELDKIQIPQFYQKILPRKKITEILDASSMDVAVCMVAPYGYGKTTATTSWLRERNRRAAWITLDETDNHEASFVESLKAAILPFAAGRDDISFSIFQSVEDTRNFLFEVASRLTKGNISADTLVLDNFHLIHDVGLLRDIRDFIHLLLGHLRVIIMSRAELPPLFNELMLKRQINLITTKEPSFSMEEMAEYFSMNGHLVSQQNLEQMHGDTEGWPAALNVILTVSSEGPIEYGENARVYVEGFLEEEIWEGLNDGVKDFLLRTSVLDKLNPSVCRALTGMGEALPTLMRLFANGLFMSRLKRDTYIYHRVFKDFLLDKLDFFGIKKQELYEKAGWWHFEKNEYEQAFLYLFKAEDLYGVSQALKKINPANMGLERYDALVSCITILNIEDLRAYPYIAVRIGLYYNTIGNIEKMQRVYDILFAWLQAGELQISQEDYMEFAWEVGWLGYFNPNEPIINNERYIKWLNYTQDNPFLREQQHIRFATLVNESILNGLRDYCPALPTIEEYIRINKESGNGILRNELALLQLEIVRAEYAYELEEFKRADEIIQAVIAETERRNWLDLYFVCITLLTKITRAVRNSSGIKTMETHMQKMIETSGCGYMWPRFHELQQRNRLAEGAKGLTEAFLEDNRDYTGKILPISLTRYITLAHALLSTGDYQETLLLLSGLEDICHKFKRIKAFIEVYLLQAIAHHGLGQDDSARQRLTEAIEMAREYGFIRVFSDEAKDIWPILELVRKKMDNAYIRKIIISCKKSLARTGVRLTDKPDELTKAELRMLKSLQASMSYEEIALDNGIKVSTVKSHVHSLYSKLQVNNRMSAIITAQNTGILEA